MKKWCHFRPAPAARRTQARYSRAAPGTRTATCSRHPQSPVRFSPLHWYSTAPVLQLLGPLSPVQRAHPPPTFTPGFFLRLQLARPAHRPATAHQPAATAARGLVVQLPVLRCPRRREGRRKHGPEPPDGHSRFSPIVRASTADNLGHWYSVRRRSSRTNNCLSSQSVSHTDKAV